MSLSTFTIEGAWKAVQATLAADLVEAAGVNVDCVGTQDFDEEGMLTIATPAARVLFLESEAKQIESSGLNYQEELRFAVLCADDDRSQDPQTQRDKSLALAYQVVQSLTGARLEVSDGVFTEPIIYLGLRPMPTQAAGMAYVPAFLISGVSQFPGTHANPQES